MKKLKNFAAGTMAAFAVGAAAPAYTADAPKTDNSAPAAVASEAAPKIVQVAGAGTKGLDVYVSVGPEFSRTAINYTVKYISEKCPTTLTEDASLGDKARIQIQGRTFDRTFPRDDLTMIRSMARDTCDLSPSRG